MLHCMHWAVRQRLVGFALGLVLPAKGYTFATLLDDGYLSRSNVHAFPTTWFLDANGHVVFSKQGWSEKLVEEFGWRIDMIRRTATVP
jgi:hypothetical protein